MNDLLFITDEIEIEYNYGLAFDISRHFSEFVKSESMNALEIYDTMIQLKQLSNQNLTMLKTVFQLKMVDAYQCNVEVINNVQMWNLYIKQQMFDHIFKVYANNLRVHGMNQNNALDQIINWFMDVCSMFLNIKLTHSSAFYVIKNVLLNCHYNRRHYYNDANGEMMYEVSVKG